MPAVWIFGCSRGEQLLPACVFSPALEMMAGGVGWGSPLSELQDFSKLPEKRTLVLKQSFLSMPADRRDVSEVSFQHCALTGAMLAFLFRGEERSYSSYCVFPI